MKDGNFLGNGKMESTAGRREVRAEGEGRTGGGGGGGRRPSFLLRRGELLHPSDLIQ